MKVISWNLLRRVGATPADVAALIATEQPDLLLMQEVTEPFAGLPALVGGSFAWQAHFGRIHGLAMWSPVAWSLPPVTSAILPGAMFHRICQIVHVGEIGIANVHLSHGQRLNRLQLRQIAERLPLHAAVLGDFNLVGPTLMPGFRDVGPRAHTHRMGEIVPLRIDRCMVRGLLCDQPRALPRQSSDHRPICVHLLRDPAHPGGAAPSVKYTGASAESPRRAGAPAGSGPRGRGAAGAADGGSA